MAVSQKLVERLNAFNAKKEERELESVARKLRAEAEVTKAAGPSKDHAREAEITKHIFDELIKLAPDAEFVPLTYHIADEPHQSWNGEYLLQQGWLNAHINHPDLHNYLIELRWERNSSSWRSSRNGKVRVVIGHYGDTEQFQQLKDGSHRYAAIAAAIFRRMAQKRAEREINRNRTSNQQAVEKAISLTTDYKEYFGAVTFSASADSEKPVAVTLKYTGNFTAEEAAKIHAVLRELNIK